MNTSGDESESKNWLSQDKKNKFCNSNRIKGINIGCVPLVWNSGPFLERLSELKQMDLMTMHKALHPRDDVHRLYVPRKEGGKRLASVEVSVDSSMRGLEHCFFLIQKKKEAKNHSYHQKNKKNEDLKTFKK